MSKIKLDLVIQGRLPPPLTPYKVRKVLRRTMQSLKADSAVLGLAFVTQNKISALNQAYHGRNKPTDVLSFAYQDVDKFGYLEGDIAVCPAYVKNHLKPGLAGLEQELNRLLIHGLMHIAGYDHRTDKTEKSMFGLQEKILTSL